MRLRSASFVRPLAVPLFTAALVAFALAGSALSAGAAPLVDQSDVGGDAATISIYYLANDFTVAARTRVTRATLWMSELGPGIGTNGVLDNLNATLGWAIYEDASGSPGEEVASGAAASLVVTDTGFDLFGFDVFQVRFELDAVPEFPAGTYWFALHDGAWHSGDDGTNVFWVKAASMVGNGSQFAEASAESPPVSWGNLEPAADQAFTLEGAQTVWDQAPYVNAGIAYSITAFSLADDFTLAAPATVSALDAWIEDFDSGDTGLIENFSGELGWALFDNGPFDLPGTRLDQGHATATVVDTGVQSVIDTDSARARIELGKSITLAPGTYWLGLHENDWLADPDDSYIRWGVTSNPTGFPAALSDGPADNFLGEYPDGAFRLWDDLQPIFSSGFEAGTACAWSATGGDCP